MLLCRPCPIIPPPLTCPGRCSAWQNEAVYGKPDAHSHAAALLPELAQLQFLRALELGLGGPAVGLPAQWGQAGAFPRLER